MVPDWAGYLRFRDAFAGALDDRLYTIDHLDGLVLSGQARLWSNDKAAIVAELKIYPTGAMVVNGLIAAGEKDEIRKLIPEAEKWGRSIGCIAGEIESREGWAREMKDDGYRVHQVRLIKWF